MKGKGDKDNVRTNRMSRQLSNIDQISVNLSAFLGSTEMPVHQLLRMGRGGLIELNEKVDEDITLMVNDTPVAKGQVLLTDDTVSIKITEVIRRPEDSRPPEFQCTKLADSSSISPPNLDDHQ
jgi:flagellar motor switch protein FliN/FliY